MRHAPSTFVKRIPREMVAAVIAPALCRLLAAVMTIAIGATAASAQSTSGLRGTVTDTSGAVMPGTTITLHHDATRLDRMLVTDDRGTYVFEGLESGLYTVRADIPGFKSVEKKGTRIGANETATVDLVLEIGVQTERVEVTATRREQLLQEVPVAVTAVSGRAVEDSNFRELTAIQYLAPGVTFSATNPVSNGGGYQIRGVGTQTYDSSVEQTVGLAVDGVVMGLSRDPGATGFGDIERVEVLRGPQGTLFGKNTSAGMIHVLTKAPKPGENTGEFTLSFGGRGEKIARATVNLALGTRAAVRASGYYQAQDGAIPYVSRDTGHVGDRENQGLRVKFWWATPRVSVLVAGEHQDGFARDAHTIESLGASALFNSLFASFPVKPGPGVYLSYQDGDWTADTAIDGGSAQVTYVAGEHTLTSITAYRQLETTQLADIDASPGDVFNNSDGGVDSRQFTQELRLTSPSGTRLEYVLGAYYYWTDSSGWATQVGKYYRLFGYPIVLGGGRRDQDGTSRNVALFGQGTYALTPRLKAIAGLRYTRDRVWGKVTVTPLPYPAVPLGIVRPYDGTVREADVSGRVGVQFQAHPDVMLYATYATGYKGPAIDGSAGNVREIAPEHVESYELGARTAWLDGRMTVNATLYWSDFRDFQAQTLDLTTSPPAFALSNAGLMRSRGVELESALRVSEAFDISAAVNYSDATFKDFTSTCYTGQPLSPVEGVGCYVDSASGLKVANYAGERLSNAPEWTYILRGSYRQALNARLVADASANWAWRSEAQAVTADPKAAIDAYGLLGANVGVGARNSRWRVGVYARNLLDERFYAPYASGTLNPGGYYRIVSPDAFRTMGTTVSLKF